MSRTRFGLLVMETKDTKQDPKLGAKPETKMQIPNKFLAFFSNFKKGPNVDPKAGAKPEKKFQIQNISSALPLILSKLKKETKQDPKVGANQQPKTDAKPGVPFRIPKYLVLPLMFLKFWFYESPVGIYKFFASLNNAFFQLFSLPLLVKTYFKPLKNEYRQGLVGFSIGMGMFVKTFFIIADVIMLVLLLLFEVTVLVSFVFLPIATFWLLFL